ncbi:hypothetical protein J9303_09260 [Bacillaceae bacterium Marseille-Q3522]|nr:hypothetical protein [Bacillaceae bacterium Marseille-Q3522]
MSKDKIAFIGSTPHHLTKAANEIALGQFAKNNKKLIDAIDKIKTSEKMRRQFT